MERLLRRTSISAVTNGPRVPSSRTHPPSARRSASLSSTSGGSARLESPLAASHLASCDRSASLTAKRTSPAQSRWNQRGVGPWRNCSFTTRTIQARTIIERCASRRSTGSGSAAVSASALSVQSTSASATSLRPAKAPPVHGEPAVGAWRGVARQHERVRRVTLQRGEPWHEPSGRRVAEDGLLAGGQAGERLRLGERAERARHEDREHRRLVGQHVGERRVLAIRHRQRLADQPIVGRERDGLAVARETHLEESLGPRPHPPPPGARAPPPLPPPERGAGSPGPPPPVTRIVRAPRPRPPPPHRRPA